MRRGLATWSSYVAHPRQLWLVSLDASGRLAHAGRSTLRFLRRLLRIGGDIGELLDNRRFYNGEESRFWATGVPGWKYRKGSLDVLCLIVCHIIVRIGDVIRVSDRLNWAAKLLQYSI
jgi:hypothetical protein